MTHGVYKGNGVVLGKEEILNSEGEMRMAMIEHLNTFNGPVTLGSIPLEWLVGCPVAHFKAKQPENKEDELRAT